MTLRLFRQDGTRHLWDRLETGFWFIPLVMAAGAVLLAWAVYWLNGLIPGEVSQTGPFVLSGSSAELRSFLVTMATTSLATAGVVFTLLTLPLSTVAAQYGSRLLRVFQGDRTTQVVLGMFVGTFVYCIASLAVIPAAELQPAAPQLSATIGFLLFLGTFASLILLIQHFSTMLQAPLVAAAAGDELMRVVNEEIQAMVVGGSPHRACAELPEELMSAPGHPVRATARGYIAYIAPAPVLEAARRKDLVVRLLLRPGCFASSDAVVALVWPADRVDPAAEREIARAFNLGRQRTPTQDIEYAFNQLAEMAVRAMSPGINDPFTVMTCLDYMGDALAVFARDWTDCPAIVDRDGTVRIIVDPVTFEQVLTAAFGMLRHAGNNNARVLLHMLDVIERIGRATASAEARAHLAHHVRLIGAESQAGGLIREDREAVVRRCDALVPILEGPPAEHASTVRAAIRSRALPPSSGTPYSGANIE